MALLLSSSSASASIFSLPSSSFSSSKPFKTLYCMIPNNAPNRKIASGSASFSPLRVAAPPTQQSSSDLDHEEEDGVEYRDEEESSASKFSWRDHWYPVSLVEDLDPRLPTPFQLLGRDLVLWNDKSTGQWVAFDDKCPHRLAPLSVRNPRPT